MDIKKRSAAIAEFKQSERKPKVLIISLKAGGVGLNVRELLSLDSLCSSHKQLTCANHVFMVSLSVVCAGQI